MTAPRPLTDEERIALESAINAAYELHADAVIKHALMISGVAFLAGREFEHQAARTGRFDGGDCYREHDAISAFVARILRERDEARAERDDAEARIARAQQLLIDIRNDLRASIKRDIAALADRGG
jgi:hypothetical protein